ncbi:autotransporter-associated beta strand repeat-containing protein, partial [Polynucleobacter sp. AM-26B4]|uniref:autotransporter-associated beta strand repeat-containing protein n=1 Tax=Polynucleobacter sp. AM-26B4 TaxID=2689103 RepID=UPI00351D8FD9
MSSRLIKNGSGTLTLSGTNTYIGGTTVSTGILSISSDANLGAVPNTLTANSITLSGGALQATESFSLNVNRGVTLTANSGLAATSGKTLIYTGIFTGNFDLAINGASQTGTVALTGAKTYSGDITVSAGSLGVYHNDALGTGTLTLAGSTTLLLGRAVTEIANDIALTGNATLVFDTNVDYLIVGGGGGGGSRHGGGGGGGAVLNSSTSLTSSTYAIVVGAGGAGMPQGGATSSADGNSSSAFGFTGLGGGAGAGLSYTTQALMNGASGGGGNNTNVYGIGSQGFNGGAGISGSGDGGWAGGGGGGAGSAGQNATGGGTNNGQGGNGGSGASSLISGTATFYGGGGGGAISSNSLAANTGGAGGSGGGGAGGDGSAGVSGVANTGGGGGAGGWNDGAGVGSYAAGSGGSGIVIVRYLGADAATGGTEYQGSNLAAGYSLHTYTSTGAGSLTFNSLAATISGIVSGGNRLTVNAAGGAITLSGANTHSGGTTVSGGLVKAGIASTGSAGSVTNGAFGTGLVTVQSGFTADLNGYAQANAFNLSGTGINGDGALINPTSTALTLPGAITLAADTTISSTGDLTITGAITSSTGGLALKNGGNYTLSNTSNAITKIAATGIDSLTLANNAALTVGTVNSISGISADGAISLTSTSISLDGNLTVTTSTEDGISLFSKTFITNLSLSATTMTTQGGNVLIAANIDDATDSDTATNGYIAFREGLTITTSGGDITLGGGNATGTSYALGSTTSHYSEGIRIDKVLSINSGGGNISIKGRSSAIAPGTSIGASGFGVYYLAANGVINSGTGTIYIEGYSQTTGGSDYGSGILFALNNSKTTTITSSNTTADAIRLVGVAKGTSSDSWGMEIDTNSPVNIYATGTGGGITISASQQVSYDILVRSELQVLAASGDIKLLGSQNLLGSQGSLTSTLWINAEVYIGSKAGTSVASSSSDVYMTYQDYSFNGYRPYITTSGKFEWMSPGSSFTGAVDTGWFRFSGITGLYIGKETNAFNINVTVVDVTVAGPVEFTTMSGTDADIQIGRALTVTGANAWITLKAAEYVYNNAAISMTGAGANTFTVMAGRDFYSNAAISGAAGKPMTVNIYTDVDKTGGGAVHIAGSSKITTYGGNLTMRGGTDDSTSGCATAKTCIAGYASNSGGDWIGGDTAVGWQDHIQGIMVIGGANAIDVGAGSITMYGKTSSTHREARGILIFSSSTLKAAGDITLVGTSNGGEGVWLNGSAWSTSGDIAITGAGVFGVYLGTGPIAAGDSTTAPTSGGTITINATGTGNTGLRVDGASVIAFGAISSTSTAVGAHSFYLHGTGAKLQSASDITISATQGTWGLTMYNNSLIQSTGGNIAITSNGTGGGMYFGTSGGIYASSNTSTPTAVPTAGGTLTINATGSTQYGIQGVTGSLVSFGAMNITVRGAGAYEGFYIADSGSFRAVGDITIDSATSGAHWGFALYSGRVIQSTEGNVSITAVGNYGVHLNGSIAASTSTTDTSASTVPATGGSITISATGRTQQGLEMAAGSLVANNAITITGSATGGYHGVYIAGTGSLKAVGNIAITATTAGAQWSFYQTGSRFIQSTTGNISITSTAAAGYGVYMSGGGLVAGNNTTTPTAGGTITINSSSSYNDITGAALRLDGTSTKIIAYGDISIYANGASLGLNGVNQQGHGIILWGASQVIRSYNGAISMTGYANRTAGSDGNWAYISGGITFYSGGVTVKAKGNVTLDGVSSSGLGLYLTFTDATGGGIISDEGNVVMNGLSNNVSYGGAIIRLPVTATLGSITISAAGQNYGYYQDAWYGSVSAKTDVNINGYATAGDGIYVNIGSISSSHGNVILSGTTTSTNTAHYGIESTRTVSAANGSVTFQASKLDTVTTLANAIISRTTNSRPDPYFAIADSSNMASAASVGLNWTGAVTANASTGYISINAKTPSITGAITAFGINLLANNQSYTLNSSSNSINTLAADIGTGSLTFVNSGVLNIGSYNGVTGITATGLTLTAGGLTDTDDAGITTTSSSTIAINNATGSFDYSGVIAGPIAITKSGAGTQTLSANNSYTGATSITAGTLIAANSGSLGTSAGGVSITSGATLALQGGITIADAINTANGVGVGSLGAILNNSGSNTITGLVTLGAATTIGSTAGTLTFDVASSNAFTGTHNLTFTGAGDITVADPIATSAGTLTKSGAGTLTLSGNNTYTGTTTLSNGILVAANSGALGTNASGTSIASGATLALQGGITITDVINTASGAGVGSLGAILNNSGSNTITGLVTLGAATTIGSTAGTLTFDVASSNALTGTHNLTFTGDGNITVADPIATSTGTLTKSGAGTLTLSGANSYTGATTISNGVLRAANSTALGTVAGGVTVASGAALELIGGITIGDEALTLNNTGISGAGSLRNISGNNTYGGLITLSTNAVRINSDSGTLTLNKSTAAITASNINLTFGGSGDVTVSTAITTGSGTLTKDGSGTLTLSGNSSYTGLTTISAGTVKLGGAGSGSNSPLGTIGSGTVVQSGAALDLAGFNLVTAEALTISGTGVSTSGALFNSSATASTYLGALTLAADSTIKATGDLTLSSTVDGAFGLTVTNTGTVGFRSRVGSSGTRLASISVSGPVNLSSDVWTTGAQTYSGNVGVSDEISLNSTSGGVTIGGTLTGIQIGSTLLYETTTANRSVNSIVYSVNNSGSFSGAITRITYRMEVTVSGTPYWAEVSFDPWANNLTASDLRIPDLSNNLVVQKIVNNMTVKSNATSSIGGRSSAVIIGSGFTGYLELWPWNYATEAGAPAGVPTGNTAKYDFNDTHNGNGTYGSFQVHNITSGSTQTVFAWNNHASGQAVDTGFGNYTGTVSDASGQTDWTFTGRNAVSLGTTGFKVQVRVNERNPGLTINGGSGAVNITGAVSGLNALTVNSSAATSTITGAISDASGSRTTLTKQGTGDLVLLGANTYTGATTISAGELIIRNNAPSTSTSGFVGPGSLAIESAGTSFTSAFSTSGWVFNSDLGGLTLGKDGNTQTITVADAASIAGPITIYGGAIEINAGLTATGTNTITIKGSGNVTDGASGFVSASNLLLLGGNVTLDNGTNNAIGTLAASGVSGLTYLDSNALTIGTVDSTDGLSASGVISIGTRTGNLTVSKGIATTNTSSSAITLNAGINTNAGTSSGGNILISGSPAISMGTNGVAKLYSGSVTDSTGLTSLIVSGSSRFRYNSDETTTNYTTALTAGLNAIYRQAITATVTTDDVTVTYGDSINLTGVTTGLVNGDAASYAINSAVYSTSNNVKAGEYTIVGGGPLGLGYTVTATNGTLTVEKKAITIAGFAVSDKDYDGTANATVTNAGSVSGQITDDLVTVASVSAAFGNKHAAQNKALTISGGTLSGADADNYTASITGSTTATIRAKAVTLTAPAVTKTYDGGLTYTTKAADLSALSTQLGIAGDTVTGITLAYTNKNAGTANKTVEASSATISDGNNGANYSISYAVNTTSTINKATVSLSASKVYDGSTSLTGYVTINTNIGTETLTYTGAAANDANVATANKFINAISLADGTNGGLAANYVLPTLNVANAPVTITAKTVGLSASKEYDGNTSLTGKVTITTGVGTQTLTYSGAAANDPNVATANKFINAISLANGSNGGVASNYQLPSLDATNAPVTITAKTLTITANNNSKTYGDTLTFGSGSTAFTQVGLIGSQTIGSVTITDTNNGGIAGAGVSGSYALTPSLATGGTFTPSNYDISYVAGSLTINKATLTVTADNQTRVYGDSNPTLTYGITGYVNSENATLAGITGTPSITTTATAASSVRDYTITSAANDLSAANYQFSYVDGTLTVNRRPVTVTADDKTRVYGDANPTLTFAVAADGTGTSRGMYNSQSLSGSVTTAATIASNVNAYAITQNTVTNANNSNYDITFVDG